MEIELVRPGKMGYAEAFEVQRAWQNRVASGDAESRLFIVEHPPPVLTLGANFHESNLLFSREELQTRGIQVAKTDRGGDVTFTTAPDNWWPIRCSTFAYSAKTSTGGFAISKKSSYGRSANLGWRVAGSQPSHRASGSAIGRSPRSRVKVSKWVSIHGVALNCENDLSGFETIIPCGIQGYGVTSLSTELGRTVSISEAEPAVIRGFESVFGVEIREASACPS